ncbi:hypothetical protein RJ639_029773 [Escallonia herrerae]|uniref:Cytochrome P450 n=1 Tax=Escallonia herrerae TaxID=1293975 RepID=A0AA89BDZ0_9ASTE|nr:hypothetical protein RJ639_029773 [Escallonia herrerae]
MALLTLFLFVRAFRKSRHGGTRLPPGPRGLPLVGYLPFLGTSLHQSFTELAQVHGPIFKLWLGSKLCVVLSSPAVIREVVRDRDVTFANRDPTVAALVFSDNANNVIFGPNGSTWRMLRKIIVREMLSKPNIDACYGLRRQEVRKIIMDVYSKVSTPIDIGELAFLTVFNATTSKLWGGTPEGKKWSASLGTEFRATVSALSVLMEKPNISDFFPLLARFDIQGVKKETEKLSLWVDQVFDSLFEQRMKSYLGTQNDQKDFLQSLLELRDQQGPKSSITLKHMKSLLRDIVAAGTDTTSAMAEWVMGELMRHPEVLKKVHEELTSVVGLNDIVEEFHIPKLQDPQLWDTPLEFRPERFLSNADKLDYSGNNVVYLPFGSGRICPGLPLADRILPYVLASFLHSFEWKLPCGTELDLSDKFGIVTKKSTPLFLVPTPRLPDLELYEGLTSSYITYGRDMVVGGTDTTSNTVEFAIAEMMNKPEVMGKAQNELEIVVGKDHHIHKLPYLHSVTNEVLRLHPALPLMVPHCLSESSIVADYTIPKGSRIFVNVWAIHRNPSVRKKKRGQLTSPD